MTYPTPVGRGRPFARRVLLALSTILAGGLAVPALAQEGTSTRLINTPAETFAVGPGGVDMRTGRYAYNETDLSIGGPSGGLALTRTLASDVLGHTNPFGNFSHNWDIMLTVKRVNLDDPSANTGSDFRANVHFGGRSQTFKSYSYSVGYGLESVGGEYSTLAFSGTDKTRSTVIHTYTAGDGTQAVFRPIGNSDCAVGTDYLRCAYVSQVTEPDGTKLDFTYVSSGGAAGGAVRLQRVTSSRGYALLLEGSGNLTTKACVLNLSRRTVPANGLCPTDASATASYSYTGSGPGRLASVTGPDQATARFEYQAITGGTAMRFIKPGQSAPWLTNSLYPFFDEEDVAQDIVRKQEFADGRSYTYSFYETPSIPERRSTIAGGNFVDNLGRGASYVYEFPFLPGQNHPGSPCNQRPCAAASADDVFYHQQTPGPVTVSDLLGRTTTFNYCDPNAQANLPQAENNRCLVQPLQSFTDAEGIRTELEYDGRRNIVRAVRHAKPGTNLPDIVTSATYDSTNQKSSDKPLSMTDANGNTINYTYAPAHGGVLSELRAPPSVGAARPLKLYTYAQRYAYVLNTAGSLAAASSPTWVPETETQCQTVAGPNNATLACDPAATRMVTTYEYGANGTADNLLVRGTVVTADGTSRRTCFAYDARGNRISETKPRAGRATCQ